MRGVLLVPANLKSIRCLVWVMHQGVMSEQLYNHRGLRQTAADARCGVVLSSVMQIQLRPSTSAAAAVGRNAALGGGTALSLMINQWVRDTGHSELGRAPILFWGFSAAASFGTTFAALYPDRTIGFIRYHTHRRDVAANINNLRGLPALLIAGANDQTAGTEDTELFWREARAAGAPWTIAVEPTAGHSSPDVHENTIKELTLPWIAAVLDKRLSANGTLRRVADRTAWLADVRSTEVTSFEKFKGDRRTANWLPDQQSARGWQLVVRPVK